MGLACVEVEGCPIDRPEISEVVPMLTMEIWPVPALKTPAF